MTKPSTKTGAPAGRTMKKALAAEEREELLRASWYDHDARWYAVADSIGLVANRLNSPRSAPGKPRCGNWRRDWASSPSSVEAGVLLETPATQPPPLMKVEFRIMTTRLG
jgi:hypothetical protein